MMRRGLKAEPLVVWLILFVVLLAAYPNHVDDSCYFDETTPAADFVLNTARRLTVCRRTKRRL